MDMLPNIIFILKLSLMNFLQVVVSRVVAAALSSLPRGAGPKAPPGISAPDSFVVVVAPSSLLCGGDH